MTTRSYCPSPFHDAVAHEYMQRGKTPLAAEFIAGKHGLHGWQVITIWFWVSGHRGAACPV